jgi:hypothetical protein
MAANRNANAAGALAIATATAIGPLLGDVSWVCTYRCALRTWSDLPSHCGHVHPFGIDRHTLSPRRAPYAAAAPARSSVLTIDASAPMNSARRFAGRASRIRSSTRVASGSAERRTCRPFSVSVTA